MRLAFLAYRCPPCSGRQRHLRFLVDELTRRGHDCHVYSASAQGDLPAGAQWRRIRVAALSDARRQRQFFDRVHADTAGDPVEGVIGLDPGPGLDLYVALEPAARDLAAARRGFGRRFGAVDRDRTARERAVFATGNDAHILLPTTARKDRFQQLYGTPTPRLHLLPPGLGPDRRLPADAPGRRKVVRETLGLQSQEYALLFISNSFWEAGLDLAITALAHMQAEQPGVKSRLLVTGADRPGPHRRLARRLQVADSVEFLGGRDDIVDLMLAADLLVHPARVEMTGTVLLEALAIGLPAVVSELCGHAHHVQAARAGILLPAPVAQEKLDRAVMRYMDGIFRADCRESARLYARLTDLSAMYREAADLVERLLGQARG